MYFQDLQKSAADVEDYLVANYPREFRNCYTIPNIQWPFGCKDDLAISVIPFVWD